MAVYSPGHFLHLLNIQHPDLVCHSLFLTGKVVAYVSRTLCLGLLWLRWGLLFGDLLFRFVCLLGNNKIAAVLPPSPLQSLPGSLVLDCYSGKVYRVTLDQSYLLQFLWNAHLDCERMAALHCILACSQDPGFPEEQVRRLLELKNGQQATLSALT